MITSTQGNILDSKCEALVNPVNCVGVMGAGLALQFKKKYPAMFKDYAFKCDSGHLKIGSVHVYNLCSREFPRLIINFPTKKHWQDQSKIEYIELGLAALIADVIWFKLQSIAIPPLGCGLGGLDWKYVRPRIMAAFERLPSVDVMLYEPK